MTHTATPTHTTDVPPWRRRLLATALIVGAGTAVGAGATGLTSDGGRRGDPPAIDATDHPNHGPDDDTTTTTASWTGDTKDHPNYGPVDAANTTTRPPPGLATPKTTPTTDPSTPRPHPGDHHLDWRRQRPPQLRTRRHERVRTTSRSGCRRRLVPGDVGDLDAAGWLIFVHHADEGLPRPQRRRSTTS